MSIVDPTTTPAPDTPDLLCGGCRYNLRGIPDSTNRCPECGRRFDRNHLLRDLVPWEQRWSLGRTGWIRAFVATVWMGSVRIPTFAQKAARPVSARDARRFRIYVLLLATATLVTGLIWWYVESNPRFTNQMYAPLQGADAAWVFFLNPISFGVLVASLVLWLIACVTVVTGFFYDRKLTEQEQKRAVALSYYTCATMAWFPLALPLAAWIISLAGENAYYVNPAANIGNAILILCWLAFVVQAFLWLRVRSGPAAPPRSRNVRRLLIAIATGVIMSIGYALVWIQWSNSLMPTRLIGVIVSTGAVATMIIVSIMAIFWFNTLRLLRLTTRAPRVRMTRIAIALPILWLALGVMIVGTVQALSVMIQILMSVR